MRIGFTYTEIRMLSDEEVNVAEFFGIDTDAKATGPFVGLDPGSGGTAMASEVDPNENNPDNNTTINNNDGETVDNNTGEPVSAADDVKTIYEDILPLLQSTLGVDDSELNKQRYLELAKFGASLMAQPGGSLTRAIGAAAQEPLEGLTRIAETKRQGKRKPAEAAINVALDIYKNKANNPTMQKIKTIASLSTHPRALKHSHLLWPFTIFLTPFPLNSTAIGSNWPYFTKEFFKPFKELLRVLTDGLSLL